MADRNNQGFNPTSGSGSPPPPPQGGQQPMMQEGAARGRPPLTKEEERIIKECNRDSFMYRGFPFAVGLGGSVYAAVKNGLLRPHPHYGPTPKTVIGLVVGYFLGKFSYANTCADKFLNEAPDSAISEAIRVRRGMPTRRELYGTDQDQQMEQGPPPSPPVQEEQPPSSVVQPPSGGSLSYDDMRKMNRQAPPPVTRVPPLPPPPQQQPSSSYSDPPEQFSAQPPSEEAPRKKKVNKYGDEVFE